MAHKEMCDILSRHFFNVMVGSGLRLMRAEQVQVDGCVEKTLKLVTAQG